MKRIVRRFFTIGFIFGLLGHADAAYQRLLTFGDGAHAARTPMSGLTDGGDGFYYGVSQYGITVNAGTVFKVHGDGSGYSVVYPFIPIYPAPGGGTETYSRLVVTNGIIYGTRNATYAGGSTSLAYSVRTNGSAYTALHVFNSGANDGKTSSGGLTLVGGMLFGLTSNGGTNNGGTVFAMQTNGANYAILKSFDNQFQNSGTNSRAPLGELVLDANNFLYGVTAAGGSSTNGGTVFKIKTDGSGFARLHDFLATTNDGYNVQTGLTLDGSGNLFGVTANGGTNDCGTIFKLKTDGSGYARLHDFNSDFVDLLSPDERLSFGGDGMIYGASQNGGTYFAGGIFKFAPDGTGYTVICTCGANEDADPVGGLSWLNSGMLLGENISGNPGVGAIYRIQPDGGGYTNLVNFVTAGGDALQPQCGVTFGSDGYLYGTTFAGGTNMGGTIYKVTTNGTGYTLLHHFSNSVQHDGFEPTAAPVLYTDGFLYGTTTSGGTNGYGIIYKIHPDGTGYTHIHDFGNGVNDGRSPAAELSVAADGTIYGTTQAGGSNNVGVVFKVNLSGTSFTILHHFTGTDGSSPTCALTQGSGGYLYGATQGGGARAGGTVFKLKTDGSSFTNLYSFNGDMFSYDGLSPASALAFGPDGYLYGTTTGGGYSQLLSDFYDGTGVYYGAGAIFKIDINGTNYSKIYDFYNVPGDPAYPQSALVLNSDGWLYGTAQSGGAALYGEVFKINTNGVLRAVCSLRNSSLGQTDGANPFAGVTLGNDGVMYGTTLNGGDNNFGTVYALNPRAVFTGENHLFVTTDTTRRDIFLVGYQGIAGQTVTLQRSTNLLTWTSINTNTLPNNADGLATFLDTNAPSPRAFYRAFSP